MTKVGDKVCPFFVAIGADLSALLQWRQNRKPAATGGCERAVGKMVSEAQYLASQEKAGAQLLGTSIGCGGPGRTRFHKTTAITSWPSIVRPTLGSHTKRGITLSAAG